MKYDNVEYQDLKNMYDDISMLNFFLVVFYLTFMFFFINNKGCRAITGNAI